MSATHEARIEGCSAYAEAVKRSALVELLKAHGIREQRSYSWTNPVTGEKIPPFWTCACGDSGYVPDHVRFVIDCHREHVADMLLNARLV
jgi:hypothetical protein